MPPTRNGSSAGQDAIAIHATAPTAINPISIRPTCLGVTLLILMPRLRQACRDWSTVEVLGSGIVTYLRTRKKPRVVRDKAGSVEPSI